MLARLRFALQDVLDVRDLTRLVAFQKLADDEQIAKILYGNWMRVFAQVLTR